ncbi:hypothetical protein LEP1GSC040_2460 [Leptospira santarosai str. 2000030832]|nr:hypothetical protein LEP1GSC040_2460 [Leptospira santarosai str. 2000030832]
MPTFLNIYGLFFSLPLETGSSSLPDISVLRLKKEAFFYIFEIERASPFENCILEI